MGNSLANVGNLLPSQVTVTAALPNLLSDGPGVGDPSYFDLSIEDPSGILDGSFDSYCIDTDTFLDFVGVDLDNDGIYGETNIPVDTLGGNFDEGAPQPFSATVYSSYDTSVLSDGLGGLIERPENLDLVNWILNNQDSALASYNVAEIQLAIWELMDDGPVDSVSESFLPIFTGSVDPANVEAIKTLAQQNGEGFVPGAGEKIAIILVPDGNISGGGADTDADGQPDGVPDSQIIITAVELAKLGDTVFEDLDADGIQDTGEQGIEGATVNLLADVDGDGVIEANEVVDTTTTDTNGNYHFTVLPGDYKVQFETPDGFDMASPANQGTDDAVDSDGPISDIVSLDAGDVDPTIDAGFFKKAGLGDFVFEDSNANGIQDAGEQGIDGVEVKLLADLDGDGAIDDIVATTTTGDDPNTTGTQQGYYEFTDLTPGVEYKVMFTQPNGFDSVSPVDINGNGSDTVDSDADPADGLMSDAVVLSSGEFNPTIDAGFYNTAGLGDFVFIDSDGDGEQDAGEQGVDGVLVKLQNPDGSAVLDGNGAPITTTTDSTGFYSFTGLTPGEYKVMFVAPDGFEFTTPNADGVADDADSDANPTNGMTQTVVLASGDFNDTLDAGLIQPAGLGDFVFEDSNANGIQDVGEQGIDGVEVKLLADLDGDGTIDDIVATTTTGDDPNTTGTQQGYYEFTDLTPGVEYKVMFTQPNGFDSVSPVDVNGDGSDTVDSDADPADGLMSDVVVLSSGEFNPTIDAGFYNTAGLGDFVFEDTDRDGIQDAGEQGIDGVEVKLLADLDGDGAIDDIVATTTTGDDPNTTGTQQGYYEFTDLTPGVEYKVMFTQPEGFDGVSPLDANGNGFDAVDSDADPNNGLMTDVVVLSSGEFNPTLDAGFFKLNADIDIEKFVNGFDADTAAEAVEIAAGDEVTFTYAVKNTGEVAFTASEVVVIDDNGTAGDTSDDFTPDFVEASDLNNNGLLDVGETWLYTKSEAAQDLSTVTGSKDVQFHLTGSSSVYGNDGNVRTFTADGVSVDVSAFSSYYGHFEKAYLGAYGGGLGVTNRYEWSNEHRVDNSTDIDYILFEFDQDVTVDRAFLDYVGYDSDISIWIGDRNGTDITHLDSTLLNSFTKENNFGGSYDRWADFNVDELTGDTLIISALTGGHNDSFKLKKLDISVAGETTIGNYQNVATVTAQTASDSDAGNYTNSVEPPFEPKHVLIEAEDMHLCNYKVEHVGDDVASGGEVIKLTSYDGYASTHFTGHSGYYQVDVAYYDENDGQSMGKVKIGGETIDTWTFDQHLGSNVAAANNRVVRTVSESIFIEQGEQIKLSGWFNQGEFARFDSIKFTEVQAPLAFHYEAEDMHLSGYQVKHVGDHIASGGELIKLSGYDGHASVNFDGPTGKYDIIVGYYDENDGQSMAQVKVGGHTVGNWTFDELLGSNVASSNNFREFTIEDVHVEAGEQVKLSGWLDGGEFARFDYVKLVSTDSVGTGNGSNTPTLESTDLFTYVNGHAPELITAGVVNDSLI
ncbi:MAG: SdrD B-like domain-containing protein [Cyanobacteria bacterium J06639_14]